MNKVEKYMKIKKVLVPLLCLLLVCIGVFTASAASITFSDVKKGKWYAPHIEYAVENGIFSGTSATTFSPDTNMTRAQFVQVFANMSNVDTSNKNVKTHFSDVPSGKWYTSAVKWASENGVVNGMGNGKFAPEQPVTREQMCVMLVNYVEKFQKKSLDSTVNTQTFADDSNISNWAKISVYKCAKASLVSGVGENRFDPKGTTTRAQGATFFSNFHKLAETTKPEEENTQQSTTDTNELEKQLFQLQYNNARSEYLSNISNQISDLENQLNQLQQQARNNYASYMEEKQRITIRFEAMNMLNSGAYQAALRQNDENYRIISEQLTKQINDLETQIADFKKEEQSPNINKILMQLANNNGMSYEEVYEKYERYIN